MNDRENKEFYFESSSDSREQNRQVPSERDTNRRFS